MPSEEIKYPIEWNAESVAALLARLDRLEWIVARMHERQDCVDSVHEIEFQHIERGVGRGTLKEHYARIMEGFGD